MTQGHESDRPGVQTVKTVKTEETLQGISRGKRAIPPRFLRLYLTFYR
jgi:hypothetical protein